MSLSGSTENNWKYSMETPQPLKHSAKGWSSETETVLTTPSTAKEKWSL